MIFDKNDILRRKRPAKSCLLACRIFLSAAEMSTIDNIGQAGSVFIHYIAKET